MKIFFTASSSGRTKTTGLNKKVLSELKRNKVKVISTVEKTYLADAPEYKKVDDLTQTEQTNKYIHDNAIKKSIFLCDGVVIEATYPSFRLGFETHFALSQQKPVLVLSQKQNYANLIDHPNFFGAKYNDFTLPDEVEKFVKHVKRYKLRNRFNMFISDGEKEYLKDVAKVHNVSMSNYVRKLLNKDMLRDT